MIATLLERFGVVPRPAADAERARVLQFPNVILTSHRREPLRFYDDLLRDKVVVISFMYTRCDGTCPATVLSLRRLQQALGPRAGREVFLYSITLDPTYDTVDVLARYATTVEAGPGWSFFTGRVHDVDRVRRKLGFVDPDPAVDADKSQHAGLLLCGSEPQDRWVACPAPIAPDKIVRLIARVSSKAH